MSTTLINKVNTSIQMQSSRAFIWVVTPRCLVWQFTGFKSFYKYIVTTGLVWQFAGFIWVVTTGLVTGTPINNWKFKNKRNSCFILLLVSLFIVCGCWVDPGDFERFFDFECLPVRRNRRLHTTETTGSQGQWLMVDIRMYEELCSLEYTLKCNVFIYLLDCLHVFRVICCWFEHYLSWEHSGW